MKASPHFVAITTRMKNLRISKCHRNLFSYLFIGLLWSPMFVAMFVAIFPATNMRPQRGRTINYKGE